MITKNVEYYRGNCSYSIYSENEGVIREIVAGELHYTGDDVSYADNAKEVYDDFVSEIKDQISFENFSEEEIADIDNAIDDIVTGTKGYWDIYFQGE